MGQCHLEMPKGTEITGFLSVAEVPGIKAGTLAGIIKPQCGLSAPGCHKPWDPATAHSASRDPATAHRQDPLSSQKEPLGCALQESLGFGDSNRVPP